MNFDTLSNGKIFIDKLVYYSHIEIIKEYNNYNGNHFLCKVNKKLYDTILPETFIIIDISEYVENIVIYYDNNTKNLEIAKNKFNLYPHIDMNSLTIKTSLTYSIAI